MAFKLPGKPGSIPNLGRSHRGGHHNYSRFVNLMKMVLPTLAVILLALVMAWPQLTSTDTRFQLGFSSLSPSAVQNLSMLNARYFGVDNRNHPFSVTADMASEESAETGIVALERPKADFVTPQGASIYVEARKGFYNQKTQVLDLQGEISLYQDQGYELHTEKARVYLKQSTAEGDAPVTGHGPQGAVNGKGFRIEEQGRQITITGQSSLSLKGAGAKK